MSVNNGRLTLTSGVPVPNTDVTGATTIYFTPYTGSTISLYVSGSGVSDYIFSEIALSLGTLTSGLPYDVFAYYDTVSGTVKLDPPLAWSSGVARATFINVGASGLIIKNGDETRRYIGTFYTTSTTTTEDSAARRFVFNFENRVPRVLSRRETAASWTLNTAGSWRQANGNSANKVECVIGFQGSAVDLELEGMCFQSAGVSYAGAIGIGEDITSLDSYSTAAYLGCFIDGQTACGSCRLTDTPVIGYHEFLWLEASNGNAVTMYGTKASTSTSVQIASGLQGSVHA